MEMIKGVTQAVAGFINIYPWLKVIQEDFFFEFKDKKWVQWCNKYLHENSWFLQCASLVLAKRIHFPTKSSWLLIASLQRLRSKEKVISDNWILLKWLSVEHACIFGSLNSVIKLSLFCCKERSALKLFSRERKIRLFLPRRKILLNPYLQVLSQFFFYFATQRTTLVTCDLETFDESDDLTNILRLG